MPEIVWITIKYIFGLFAFLFIFGLALILLRSKEAAVDTETGQRVVRFGWFMRIFSIVFLGFIIYFGAEVFETEDPQALWEWIFWGTFFSLFLVAGIYLIVVSFTTVLYFNDSGFEYREIFRKPRRMKWSEVDVVEYSKGWDSYIFRNMAGDKIKVPNYMSGLEHLMRELKRRRPEISLDVHFEIYAAQVDESDYRKGLQFFPKNGVHLRDHFANLKFHEDQIYFLEGMELELVRLRPVSLEFAEAKYLKTEGEFFDTLDIILPHKTRPDFKLNINLNPDNVVVGLWGLNISFNEYFGESAANWEGIVRKSKNEPPEHIREAVNYLGFLLESTYVIKSVNRGKRMIRQELDLVRTDGTLENLGHTVIVGGLYRLNFWKKDTIKEEAVSFLHE